MLSVLAFAYQVNIELKSIEHAVSQLLDAVMPEPESLINSPELRPSSNAIQSKKLAAMLPREFACVAQKRMRDITPLLVRVDGDLVNERGRAIGDFRPEEAVFQLESEDADWPFIIEGSVVHARADMLFHRRFTHLRRTPQRVASFRQVRCGRTKHVGDEGAECRLGFSSERKWCCLPLRAFRTRTLLRALSLIAGTSRCGANASWTVASMRCVGTHLARVGLPQ